MSRRSERRQHRMEKRQEKHNFKLAKMAVRSERRAKVQDSKVEKSLSKDRANEVAYQNHMEPTHSGTLMGALEGGAKLASAAGEAIAKVEGAGLLLDKGQSSGYTPGRPGADPYASDRAPYQPQVKEYDVNTSASVGAFGNPLVIIGLAIAGLLFMSQNNRDRGRKN